MATPKIPPFSMKDISDSLTPLIAAIAQLMWPIIVLVIVCLFRKDISELLRRIRKGTIFGQDVEMDQPLDKFQETVKEAQEEIPPSFIEEKRFEQEIKTFEREEREVLEAARINPELGIIRLSSILERETRTLLGVLGYLSKEKRLMTGIELHQVLVEKGFLTPNTTNALNIFRNLRNQIVHGQLKVENKNTLRVLDIGLTLLKTIKAIPHEINIVYDPGVILYSDSECTQKIHDAKGLILETTSPGKAEVSKRIFPTTRPEYYQKGKQVTWEWNLSKVWQQAWYIDPDTKEKQKGWDSAGEFVGRHIDDI